MSKRATPRTRTPATSRPSRHVRAAQERRNKLLFGLPLAADVKAEITEFWLVALEGRPFISRKGMNLSAAHNEMVKQALDLEPKALDWNALVWLEHDHTFNFPIVFDYMERLDLKQFPLVGFLYVERMAPNDPVGSDKSEDGEFPPFSEDRMAEFGTKPGLFEVTGGVGMGCTIIARHVLEAMAKLNPEKPWYYAPAELGGEMTDDIWFCQQAMAAGFPVHIETRFRIGHWGVCNYGVEHYWANKEAGRRAKVDVLVEELIARRQAPDELIPEVGGTGRPAREGEVPTPAGVAEAPAPAPLLRDTGAEEAYAVRDKRAARA